MESLVETFQVFALSAKGLLARPKNPDGEVATSDNIAAIHYAAFEEVSGIKTGEGDLVPADVLLSTTAMEEQDAQAYTFRWPAPGSLWPEASKRYRIQVTFTPVGDEALPYMLAWQANTIRVFS